MNEIILLKLSELKSTKNAKIYKYGVCYDTVLNYKFNVFLPDNIYEDFKDLVLMDVSEYFVLGLDIKQNCLCYKLKK